jgi:hypothetical protein
MIGVAILPVVASTGAGRVVDVRAPLRPMLESFGIPFRRSFYLFRANLADQWLPSVDLKYADLGYANLSRVTRLISSHRARTSGRSRDIFMTARTSLRFGTTFLSFTV